MKIRNIPVPEGINVSKHSPIADLFLLSGGLLLAAGLLGLALIFVAGSLARHTPVDWEVALAEAVFAKVEPASDPGEIAVLAELQGLADRLSAHMDLPDGLQVRVHYLDEEMINAFATLGGHVFLYRGLIEKMGSENALAMVLAHEIGHARHRDPAAGLSGALAVQLVLSLVLGNAPESLHGLITGPNALLFLAFGREAERQADSAALAALAGLYGHVGAASEAFELFEAEAAKQGGEGPPAILSSHPLSRDRIEAIGRTAVERGWARQGTLTPLPEALSRLGRDGEGAPESQ